MEVENIEIFVALKLARHGFVFHNRLLGLRVQAS
ncbi:hypothetical protein B0G71_8005 [Paraburkholderia sp. BL27I4N3]|nr:hypothetical protein B0G71_8005 [Paraburkholderia sp. BL27I4N3]